MSHSKSMKRRYLIIIGISVPLIIFGVLVLAIADNLHQIFSNSDKWMIELEPELDLSSKELSLKLRNEDFKEIHIYRIQSLEDYFESLTPNFEKQFKDAINTKNRFVFYIDKNSGYSEEQIQEIFTEVDGIRKARELYNWLLH